MRKKTAYIIIFTLILSICMALVDRFINPPYAIRATVKAVFCFGCLFGYCVLFQDETNLIKSMFSFKKTETVQSFLFGLGLYFTILGAYFILRIWIDFSDIVSGFTYGLDTKSILAIFAYVALCNSFIEEVFFRCFSFMTLKPHFSRKGAYIFSAIAFAGYHVGMMTNWPSPLLIVLSIFGLAIGACIFNFVDERSNSVYPSWFIHMFANFALNSIALIETFNIL